MQCDSSQEFLESATGRILPPEKLYEILDELSSQQNCCDLDIIQDRPNLPNDLKDIIFIIEKSHGL